MADMKKDKAMPPSLERLLKYAQQATKDDPVPIEDIKDLWAAMELTSAVVSNWMKRGVSIDGARKAEQMFGCTVTHILDGTPMRPISPQDSISGAVYTLASKLCKSTELSKSMAVSALRQVAEYPDDPEKVAESVRALESAIAIKRPAAHQGNAERA